MYNEDMHCPSLQRKLKKVPFISLKSLDCSIKPNLLLDLLYFQVVFYSPLEIGIKNLNIKGHDNVWIMGTLTLSKHSNTAAE